MTHLKSLDQIEESCTMSSEKVNRQRLIEEAINLFRRKGYHNTTMDDIARACNIKKPSIYHHIPSREALLISAIEACHKQFKDTVLAVAFDSSLDVNERIVAFTNAIETFFTTKQGRCLIGNLVHELSGSLPAFDTKAKAFFKEWAEAITSLLKNKADKDELQDKAEDIIAQIQGALILGQLYNKNEPLQRATQRLLQQFC